MKNKIYFTDPKSNKIVEKDKFDTPNTQIHDRSLSWLGTGTSLKKWRDLTSFMYQNLNVTLMCKILGEF